MRGEKSADGFKCLLDAPYAQHCAQTLCCILHSGSAGSQLHRACVSRLASCRRQLCKLECRLQQRLEVHKIPLMKMLAHTWCGSRGDTRKACPSMQALCQS